GDKKFRVKTVNDEEVVKEVREHELLTIQRHCFISVRSDWTDNTELFGFYNLIEQKYHVPYFLNFLLTALNNPEYPFFVILDEMNLSKVEHYFSDVLSCLESRVSKNGEIHQEKIILYNGLSQLPTDTEDFEYIPNAVEIPLNLYITGTVNIDESTYMFSPKVLDRANVIEFNEVNLEAYGNNSYTEDDDTYKLSDFPDFTQVSLATKDAYETLPDIIKKHLVEINSILEKYNLHFGYRTANEVALYIHNAMKHINDEKETQLQALDCQFIQKIFPKINGGYATLEAPLNEVLLYLSGQENLSKIEADNTEFPKTVSKLQRMHHKLSMNGYTSFID
ncbi:MAG: McrB family protein, partial [Methanobacterium sp.]